MTVKTRKWTDIRGKLSPEREAKVARIKETMRAEMLLAELRKARGLTQETLAETMEIAQGEVSKIERRADLYLTTLRRFVEAMNGELVLVARFPDGDVPLKLQDDADDDADDEHQQPRRRRAVAAG
jgi:transcriptional regulator with XRE-family HTH domain